MRKFIPIVVLFVLGCGPGPSDLGKIKVQLTSVDGMYGMTFIDARSLISNNSRYGFRSIGGDGVVRDMDGTTSAVTWSTSGEFWGGTQGEKAKIEINSPSGFQFRSVSSPDQVQLRVTWAFVSGNGGKRVDLN